MARRIVLAEKPAQAARWREAVGDKFGPVLCACGHILTLEEPAKVNPAWAQWSTDLLWPGHLYPLAPVADKLSFLKDIKSALVGCETVVLATDPDREGQLIGDEILAYLGFKGRVLRALVLAEDTASVQHAFANLRPNDEFRGLYAAGLARANADLVANLSLTRTATVSLKARDTKGAIGIGRVKTAVLAILGRREEEIQKHDAEALFAIEAQVVAGEASMLMVCDRLPSTLEAETKAAEQSDDDLDPALKEKESTKGRIKNRNLADALAKAVQGYRGPLVVKESVRAEAPPALFDLTTLQSEASKRFGWTGGKTLDIAQKLYSEHHVLTYPRSEAKHLPEAAAEEAPAVIAGLLALRTYAGLSELLSSPTIRKGRAGHYSDQALKGAAHYAISPNPAKAGELSTIVPTLSADEAKLFDLVARRFMAALAPDAKSALTKVQTDLMWKDHRWSFHANGKAVVFEGWRSIWQAITTEKTVVLPRIPNGAQGSFANARVRASKTKAPARYTEGALIQAMADAWRLVEDPQLREKLKRTKGIGTSATRGEVVEGLKRQGQVALKGKHIVPTPEGMQLFQTLKEITPNLVDPGRTAAWEALFTAVETGTMGVVDVVEHIATATRSEIARIVEASGKTQIAMGELRPPTEKMAELAKKVAKDKGLRLSRAALKDFKQCQLFLDTHLGGRGQNGNGGAATDGPPSEKALSYALRIAGGLGKEIPDDVKASWRRTKQWIDEHKDLPRPPSDAQLARARKLASRLALEVPQDALADHAVLSSFIATCKQMRHQRKHH